MNPSKDETCFTTDDDDCSGTDNDDGAVGCTDYFSDVDGDGFGSSNDIQCLCYTKETYTSIVDTDCDDADTSISPAQLETCDTPEDEDCDGQYDELNAENCIIYHYDWDGDDYGLASDYRCRCEADFRIVLLRVGLRR